MPAADVSTPSTSAPHHRAGSRPWRRWFGTATVTVLGLLLTVMVVAVVSGAYQIRPVLTGSMRPGLPVGGVVVTHRIPLDEVKVRDVIVFHRPGRPGELVVHRVIRLTRSGSTVTVKTQGDNNDTPDPWTVTLRGATAYRATFTVPLLGYPAVWIHSADGQRELLIVIGLVIAGVAIGAWGNDRRKAVHTDPLPDIETECAADVDAGADRGADCAAVSAVPEGEGSDTTNVRPARLSDSLRQDAPVVFSADSNGGGDQVDDHDLPVDEAASDLAPTVRSRTRRHLALARSSSTHRSDS